MAAQVFIGTSGWHYKHWLGVFYPEKFPSKQMLNFYASHFKTVEINNSFYQLPAATTFELWRDTSPKDFVFAVKASRFITHMKKLTAPKPSTEKLFLSVTKLENKLGPILFQLPPRWQLNLERLNEFLEALPREYRYSFEFRDRSWLVDAVYEVLARYNAAFCFYDLAGFQSPVETTADFVYVRLHGPGGAYQGDYSRQQLKGWAKRLKQWRRESKSSYVYFDNDQQAFAAKNAGELQEMI